MSRRQQQQQTARHDAPTAVLEATQAPQEAVEQQEQATTPNGVVATPEPPQEATQPVPSTELTAADPAHDAQSILAPFGKWLAGLFGGPGANERTQVAVLAITPLGLQHADTYATDDLLEITRSSGRLEAAAFWTGADGMAELKRRQQAEDDAAGRKFDYAAFIHHHAARLRMHEATLENMITLAEAVPYGDRVEGPSITHHREVSGRDLSHEERVQILTLAYKSEWTVAKLRTKVRDYRIKRAAREAEALEARRKELAATLQQQQEAAIKAEQARIRTEEAQQATQAAANKTAREEQARIAQEEAAKQKVQAEEAARLQKEAEKQAAAIKAEEARIKEEEEARRRAGGRPTTKKDESTTTTPPESTTTTTTPATPPATPADTSPRTPGTHNMGAQATQATPPATQATPPAVVTTAAGRPEDSATRPIILSASLSARLIAAFGSYDKALTEVTELLMSYCADREAAAREEEAATK